MKSKEEIMNELIECTCSEGYKSRRLSDPNCPRHSYDFGIEEAMDEYAKLKSGEAFRFAEWASHSDWTYLPSKRLWHNEEEEENITPKTTEQLYNLYLESKKQIKTPNQ